MAINRCCPGPDHDGIDPGASIARVPEADFAWKPHEQVDVARAIQRPPREIATWCGHGAREYRVRSQRVGIPPDSSDSREPPSPAGLLGRIRREGGGRPRQSWPSGLMRSCCARGHSKAGGPGNFHAAPNQRHPRLRDEPLDSSPRTVERIFPAPQRARSRRSTARRRTRGG